MELIQTSTTTKKHVRQPPSVPFLWEVKPGIAKKDWKPDFPSVSSAPMVPPVKHIASVPFIWEEKPGTPLPSFSQPSQESVNTLLSLPPIDTYLCKYVDVFEDGDDESSGEEDDGEDEEQSLYKLDLKTFGSETDDSYCSAPSLLANCLVSSVAISTAVPAQNVSLAEEKSGPLESPSSPSSEMESSTSSYATGTSSLVGSSFLECLFPLYPPKSGFLEKAGNPDPPFTPPPQRWNQNFNDESNGNIRVRRPPTLGELIMMSRRRSCRRKAAQMKKQNLSMVNLQALASTCNSFTRNKPHYNTTMTIIDSSEHRIVDYFPMVILSNLFTCLNATTAGIHEGSFWVLHISKWHQDDRGIARQEKAIATTETHVVKTKAPSDISNTRCSPFVLFLSRILSFLLLGL